MGRRHKKPAREQRTKLNNLNARNQNEATAFGEARKPVAIGLVAVVLMGIFGLGTGWFAGKALSGALRPAASMDSSEVTGGTVPSPQPDANPQPTAQPPAPEPERPQQKKTEEAKDRDASESNDERPSVEKLGRKALKKILKEIEKEIDPDKPRSKRKDKNE